MGNRDGLSIRKICFVCRVVMTAGSLGVGCSGVSVGVSVVENVVSKRRPKMDMDCWCVSLISTRGTAFLTFARLLGQVVKMKTIGRVEAIFIGFAFMLCG